MRVPATPTDCNLSHRKWYDAQREALEWIAGTSERVLLLDAPTATGKTALIQALQYMFDSPVYAALWSRRLQRQCEQEIDCRVVMGRSNFMCNKEAGETCEFDWCGSDPETKALCPYRIQFEEGLEAPIAVLNYALLLTHLGMKNLPPRDVLICDEGHMLEDALANHLDVRISRLWLEDIKFPWQLSQEKCDAEMLRDWAETVLNGMAADEHPPKDKKQRARWGKVKALAEKVLGLVYSSASTVPDDNGFEASLRVLWPLEHFPTVASHFERILVMSATLGDVQALAKEMVLKPDEYSALALRSVIPVDRRLIYVWPVANLHKNATALDYSTMTSGIIILATQHFPRDKGLIHVSSYKMAERLGRLLSEELPGRILVEDGTQATKHIRKLWTDGTEPRILCTPAASMGADYPFVFPWQVIAKLPYPYLGDQVVFTRSRLRPKWYTRKTADGIVQMAGRVTRTPSDEGVTIITDSTFEQNVFRRAPNSFPAWFKEALRWKTE